MDDLLELEEGSTYPYNKGSLTTGQQIKVLMAGKEYMRGKQNAFWIGYPTVLALEKKEEKQDILRKWQDPKGAGMYNTQVI